MTTENDKLSGILNDILAEKGYVSYGIVAKFIPDANIRIHEFGVFYEDSEKDLRNPAETYFKVIAGDTVELLGGSPRMRAMIDQAVAKYKGLK